MDERSLQASVNATIAADRAGVVDFNTDPKSPVNLSGSRILVTGGASGLGEGFVRKFCATGAHVVIADLNHDAGEKLANSLVSAGHSAKFVEVDVTSWESQVSMFKTALQFFSGGEMDILVTSAGVTGHPSWDMQPVDPSHLLDENGIQPPSSMCLDINLMGSMYSLHLAVKYAMGLHHLTTPSTTPNPSKSIILIGSYAGFNFNLNKPDYTAAKWGIRGLFRSSRIELAKTYNIRVNMLAPCFIPTPMTQSRVPMLEKQGFQMGKLEDAVEVVWRMAVDKGMNGRAVGIGKDGIIDLGDDLGGNEGGDSRLEGIRRGMWRVPGSATLGFARE